PSHNGRGQLPSPEVTGAAPPGRGCPTWCHPGQPADRQPDPARTRTRSGAAKRANAPAGTPRGTGARPAPAGPVAPARPTPRPGDAPARPADAPAPPRPAAAATPQLRTRAASPASTPSRPGTRPRTRGLRS